ncbi:hypothetical protein U1Q18_045067, partial [Sarracenia purpurea var. burkii]
DPPVEDLATEDSTAEDPSAEDTTTGAASHDAGHSTSAPIQGESSRPLDLASLHTMLVVHIALYQRNREEY